MFFFFKIVLFYGFPVAEDLANKKKHQVNNVLKFDVFVVEYHRNRLNLAAAFFRRSVELRFTRLSSQ